MKKTILFLDGDKRAALSIIRSIGKLNTYRILTAGKSQTDLCRFSKYCEKHYKYIDPEIRITSFIQSLKEIIKKSKPDYIFPCSDISLFSIYTSAFYDEIKEKLIAPNKDTYLLSFDKDKIQKIASSCGVKIIEEASFNECEFPIVVKPRQSRTIIENKMIYGFRKIVHNNNELEKALFEVNQYDKKPLLQKMIKGKGFGVFAAAKDGELFAAFVHERVREVPPGGGVSTLRKSIEVHPSLLEASRKIVLVLNWTGILMIEFKGIKEEDAHFMEINGRPWGSMDLAVSSGVDFPRMMIDLFIHQLSYQKLQEKYQRDYELETYSKWIVGELNFIRYLLKESISFKQKIKLLLEVLFHKPKKITYDTFHANDPLPFFMESLTILKSGLMKSLLKLKTKIILSLKEK